MFLQENLSKTENQVHNSTNQVATAPVVTDDVNSIEIARRVPSIIVNEPGNGDLGKSSPYMKYMFVIKITLFPASLTVSYQENNGKSKRRWR